VLSLVQLSDSLAARALGFLVLLVILCIVMCVNAKRLHDMNQPAWWMLTGLIPFVARARSRSGSASFQATGKRTALAIHRPLGGNLSVPTRLDAPSPNQGSASRITFTGSNLIEQVALTGN